MKKFKREEGIVLPIMRANIDTDAIIPKQFLKSIKRTGFGVNLFDEWRYLDEGYSDKPIEDRQINHNFILNKPQFKDASILLVGDNFGCGSSREHAVWALEDYGFRAVIAPSFADIFYNNCFNNGVLPIVLPNKDIDELFEISSKKLLCLEIDLKNQQVVSEDKVYSFEIDEFRKECLLNGLDTIGVTLKNKKKIEQFEKNYQVKFPWFFESKVI